MQVTVTEALDVSLPSLLVETLPVLLTVAPQVAAVVGELMCTVAWAPEARSPMLQVSTPVVIEQVAAAVPPLTDQLRPALLGKVSVTVTPWAVPAPVLLTVRVKPMLSPAFTGEASAVLRMWM